MRLSAVPVEARGAESLGGGGSELPPDVGSGTSAKSSMLSYPLRRLSSPEMPFIQAKLHRP